VGGGGGNLVNAGSYRQFSHVVGVQTAVLVNDGEIECLHRIPCNGVILRLQFIKAFCWHPQSSKLSRRRMHIAILAFSSSNGSSSPLAKSYVNLQSCMLAIFRIKIDIG
jgi:hypothetical protein